LLARIRQRQTPWAQRVLGLFVVAWLNMALQPCAMAFGDNHQHDKEHCPPVAMGEASSSAEHDANSADMLDELCNITGAQCAFLDDYHYDGRIVELKVKHAPSDVPLGVMQSVATSPLPDGSPVMRNVDHPPGQSEHRPPLNLLFCVYQI